MTEPKLIYNTLNDYELAAIRRKEREANQTMTINGEPLSTKALHEIIVSQSMTIDRLLGEVGRLNDENKKLKLSVEYDEALIRKEYHKLGSIIRKVID